MLTLASTCLRYVVHSAFHLIQYATSVAKSLQVLTAREERVMASVETGCDTLGREYRQSNHVWAAVFALLMVGGILPPYPANADEQFRVAPVVLGYRLTSGWKDTSGMLFGSPLDAIQFAYEGVKICAGASHPERAYEEYQPDQYTKLFWAGWYYIVTPPPQVPGCDPPGSRGPYRGPVSDAKITCPWGNGNYITWAYQSETGYPYCVRSNSEKRPNKRLPDCTVGNPCDPATGAKVQREVDYEGTGPFPLRFERTYHSQLSGAAVLAPHWSPSYLAHRMRPQQSVYATVRYPDPVAQMILGLSDAWIETAILDRADGGELYFTRYGGSAVWTSEPDVRATFEVAAVHTFCVCPMAAPSTTTGTGG
jgi:hypothetical protein